MHLVDLALAAEMLRLPHPLLRDHIDRERVFGTRIEIQEELRSQYAVAYKPPDFKADGSYRPIEITALDRKLHIRARKGYFAPLAQ